MEYLQNPMEHTCFNRTEFQKKKKNTTKSNYGPCSSRIFTEPFMEHKFCFVKCSKDKPWFGKFHSNFFSFFFYISHHLHQENFLDTARGKKNEKRREFFHGRRSGTWRCEARCQKQGWHNRRAIDVYSPYRVSEIPFTGSSSTLRICPNCVSASHDTPCSPVMKFSMSIAPFG